MTPSLITGEEIRNAKLVANRTSERNIPLKTGTVEHEQKGVTNPPTLAKAAPRHGPIFPNRLFIESDHPIC